MNFDSRTKAREEEEDEEIKRMEDFDDMMIAIRHLLLNGNKKAAISFIDRMFSEEN